MKSFEYEEIELDNVSWKNRLKEGLKMFYQRPVLSFIPFLIITYLIFFKLFYIDVSLTIGMSLLLSIYIIPLLTFELCVSNDNSKIPFRGSYYLKSEPIRIFYLILTLLIVSFLAAIFALTIFGEFLEYIFPFLKDSPMESEGVLPFNKEEYSSLALTIVDFAFKMLGAVFTTMFLSIGYLLLFFVYLILHVSKMYNLSGGIILIKLAFDGLDKNAKLILFIGGYSFLQSFSMFFLKEYRIVAVILWSIFSSYGVILCYLISKEISGGGSKLEEKKSIIREVFESQPKLINLEG
jgi:hypothetical protein